MGLLSQSLKMKKQEIIIPGIGPSFNKFQNMNVYKRGNLVKEWENKVGWLVKRKLQPVKNYPVVLKFVGVFTKNMRSYDCVNMAPTAKMIEDGLVQAGILKNDSRKYVSEVKLQSHKEDWLTKPYTILTIYEPEALS